MHNNKILNLINYLYPTDELMDFMCNDLYQELLGIIKPSYCINSKNMVNSVRQKNLNFVKNKINDFISTNINYMNILFDYYKHKNLNIIIDDILIGFVFYIANTTLKYNNIDIFHNKQSICYEKMSIFEILEF